MIGGQTHDTVETDKWNKKSQSSCKNNLFYIHRTKTAALITASLQIGACLSDATAKKRKALEHFGEKIGLAFQITDDILDIIGNKKLLGKNGSDKDNNKLTYPAVYGLAKSQKIANDLIKKAKASLAVFFGENASPLKTLADYILTRQF